MMKPKEEMTFSWKTKKERKEYIDALVKLYSGKYEEKEVEKEVLLTNP